MITDQQCVKAMLILSCHSCQGVILNQGGSQHFPTTLERVWGPTLWQPGFQTPYMLNMNHIFVISTCNILYIYM